MSIRWICLVGSALLLAMVGATAPEAAAARIEPAPAAMGADDRPHQRATTAFLTVGDPAAPIDVAHWLKGEEVTTFGDGRIYVLEFWATWCKYCRSVVPHLAEWQEEFRDEGVTFVAVSDEKLQTVFEFLASPEWNSKTSFTVGTDPDLSTQKDYMEAAAAGDIPTAFLIGRDGRIEWIGHPRAVAKPLRAVVNGTWDRDAFRMRYEEEVRLARTRYEHQRQMKAAYEARDWPRLCELFDQIIATDPKPEELKIQKFLLMIGEMNDPERGYDYGRALLAEFHDHARALNNLAWFVVDSDAVGTRDLDFALEAAERAAELSRFKDAAVLDTLARVHFERGQTELAITWQRRAIEALDDDDMLEAGLRAALARYEQAANPKPPDGPHDHMPD